MTTDTYNPYGPDHQALTVSPTVKTRPMSPGTFFAAAAGKWAARRAVTRLSPLALALLWPIGTVLAVTAPPKVIVVLGVSAMVVTYAIQRHATTDDAAARQWALRTTAAPGLCTCLVLFWWEMHRRGGDLVTTDMVLLYVLFSATVWAWLYTASHVGSKVAWEKAQKDFAPVAKRVGLAGAKVVNTVTTKVGTRRTIDVRGTALPPGQVSKALASALAAHDGLPPGAVNIRQDPAHAGWLEVSTWQHNPWKHPIPHPLADDGFPLAPGGRTRRLDDPIPIGQDPETGEPITFLVADDDGAKHTLIGAMTGGGKTTLLNNVLEHLTACVDDHGRPLVQITLIDMMKGLKDAANWAPAVHRVYGGSAAVDGALAELQRAVKLIEYRAAQNGRRAWSKHKPSVDEPFVVIVLDEAHALLGRGDKAASRAKGLVELILRTGRSEGVCLLLATQRGMNSHLGSSEAKANVAQTVILPVRRRAEMGMFLPDWAELGAPDMVTYGGGAKGPVTVIRGTSVQSGRTFALHDLMTIRAIAAARCLPEHEGMLAPAPDMVDVTIVDPVDATVAELPVRYPQAVDADGDDVPDDQEAAVGGGAEDQVGLRESAARLTSLADWAVERARARAGSGATGRPAAGSGATGAAHAVDAKGAAAGRPATQREQVHALLSAADGPLRREQIVAALVWDEATTPEARRTAVSRHLAALERAGRAVRGGGAWRAGGGPVGVAAGGAS